jgi:uncharacterized membrane protein YdjX (TVP38/TMEM64 family)
MARQKAMKSKLVLLLLLIVGISIAIIYRDQLNAQSLEAWIDSAGVAGPLLFMVIYAVGTVFFLPGSVLTLTGGALFGPYWGTFYNLTAATIGAVFSFLIARYLASDWVEQRTGGRLKQLKQGVEGEGWYFVAFVRLVPLFPFNLLNYALGLTRIKFSHYAITTYICMLPGAIAYTYLGFVGREAAGGGEDLIQKMMMALALLAMAAFIPRLIGRLRQKPMMNVTELKQLLDAGEDQLLLDVRSAEDFVGEKGHIDKAINLPLEELESRREELSDYLERPVLIVCTTDRRSSKAAQKLAKEGFTDVHVVKGGMTDWNQNGYPTA